MKETMTEHLIESAFDCVYSDDRYVMVHDPGWLNYRVYCVENDPEILDWIDAPNRVFATVDEAIAAIEKREMMPPGTDFYQQLQEFMRSHRHYWTQEVQKQYWELREAYERL
ncbi:MAG: hypothetical protein ACRC2R_10905 [Xenococcaceae cyanobacterium]